jgi:hypothetical protein
LLSSLNPDEKFALTRLPIAAACGCVVERMWPYATGKAVVGTFSLEGAAWFVAGVVVGAVVVTALMVLMDVKLTNRLRVMATACMLGIGWPQAGGRLMELLATWWKSVN